MKFTSSKQWVVAGVTSFGIGCGRTEYSGVYSRVAVYSDWINTTVNAHDEFIDPVLTARDIIFTDELTNDVFPGELTTNICSCYFLAPVLYIAVTINVYLVFM